MNKSTAIDIDIYETLETINVNPNSIETNDDVEFNDLTEVDEFIKADIRHDGEDVMKIYTLPSEPLPPFKTYSINKLYSFLTSSSTLSVIVVSDFNCLGVGLQAFRISQGCDIVLSLIDCCLIILRILDTFDKIVHT